MAKGKKICKILKEIRRQIAEVNDIEYVVEECQYKGDCLGTCPKCEAEVRYLEQQLHQRQLFGKAVVLAGVSVGMFTLSSCNFNNKTQGELPVEDTVYQDSLGQNKEPKVDVVSDDTDMVEGMIDSGRGGSTMPKIKSSVKFVAPVMKKKVKEERIPKDSTNSDLTKKEEKEEDTVIREVIIEDPEEKIYEVPNEMPTFPGGTPALEKYMKENLKYPEEFKGRGKVACKFVVKEDGSISNIWVVRSLEPILDEEAVRLISTMPKWNPGRHKGKIVKSRYILFVSF